MSDLAFTQLVSTHHGGLYRFALSLTQSEADASDLVQQTCLTWAQTGRQLREGSRAKTRLYASLHRAYLEMRRRTTRLAGQSVETGESERPSISPEVAEAADSEAVLKALATLDEDYRAPLVLFYLEHHSCHEIAEILELPLKTVVQRLSRARAGLQRALEGGTRPAPTITSPPADPPASK